MSKKARDKGGSALKKTLPEQILQAHQVAYEPYEINVLDLSEAERAARLGELGIEESDIYKTLALVGDKTGPLIGVVPLTAHLSEKRLAAVSGNKSVSMIPLKDLRRTTGYVHGANNPVGIWELHHGKFPIYIDSRAQAAPFILVSAGELGRSDKLSAVDLAALVGASFADIAEG